MAAGRWCPLSRGIPGRQDEKSKSSHQWLDRHFNDAYVKRAQVEGYRSRAAFKLLELQEKDQLIAPGQVVVDLGAAPGGWSQVAGRLVGDDGRVFALDILPMDPLPGWSSFRVIFARMSRWNSCAPCWRGGRWIL